MPNVAPPENTPDHPDPTGRGERGLEAKAQATAMGDVDRMNALEQQAVDADAQRRQRLIDAGIINPDDDAPEPAVEPEPAPDPASDPAPKAKSPGSKIKSSS